MSAVSSPYSLDDYVLIQPTPLLSLPLRTKVTQKPRTNQDNHELTDDEYECISSPDTVRSLSSTPPARSISPDDSVSEESQSSEDNAVPTPETYSTPSNVSDHDSVRLDCSKNVLCQPRQSKQQNSEGYSFPPIAPTIEHSYVYTSPSEDGYPGSGVLSPTPGAKRESRNKSTVGDFPVSHGHSIRETEYSGHRWIDVKMLDHLVDHACAYRLRTDMKTSTSRDALLRFQMIKRIQDLPHGHPVIRKAITDPALLHQPCHQHWTYTERLDACLSVLTDAEKLALCLLHDSHTKHFHTSCLFSKCSAVFRNLNVTVTLTEDARRIARAAHSPATLFKTAIDAILQDNELVCNTQLEVISKAQDFRREYDISTPEIFHNSNDYHVPGTFQSQSPPPVPQLGPNDTFTEHFKREAVKYILARSISEAYSPRLTSQIVHVSSPPPPPNPDYRNQRLPTQDWRNRHALADYQMQLMLLEQQNRKRRARDQAQDANALTDAQTTCKRLREMRRESLARKMKTEGYFD